MKVPYKQLITIFKDANGKNSSELAIQIANVRLSAGLKSGLIEALSGDNRNLNEWLFSEAILNNKPFAWIAPVKAVEPTYVWMVGIQPEIASKVRKWFVSANETAKKDPLLQQHVVTPPLLFVKPIALSKSIIGDDSPDEFAIFQTGYVDSPAEVSDLEQRMVINSELATLKRQAATERLKKVLVTADSHTLSTLEENLELFAILHSEGHNQGHFVGKWPFEDEIKKTCIMYEAIEEFKACLASILLVEHLPLSQDEKDAFALSVFVTRFFGYGYEAFCLQNQKRETVREVTVGLLFFEWLSHYGAIFVSDGKLTIQTQKISRVLRCAYEKIDTQESGLKSADKLRSIAKNWYKFAFPFGDYSPNAKLVYTNLASERR